MPTVSGGAAMHIEESAKYLGSIIHRDGTDTADVDVLLQRLTLGDWRSTLELRLASHTLLDITPRPVPEPLTSYASEVATLRLSRIFNARFVKREHAKKCTV